MNYRNQSIVLGMWIVSVIFIFKLIPDRQVASVVAGTGFVVIPVSFLFFELKRIPLAIIHISALVIFLVASALPIFLLRVLNWGVDFNQLSVAGIGAPELHNISNALYLLMLGSALFHWWRSSRKE